MKTATEAQRVQRVMPTAIPSGIHSHAVPSGGRWIIIGIQKMLWPQLLIRFVLGEVHSREKMVIAGAPHSMYI